MTKVINKQGMVIEVSDDWKNSSYPPDEDGYHTINVGGFSYMEVKETNLPITHKPAEHISLRYRGDLIPINCKEYKGQKQDND